MDEETVKKLQADNEEFRAKLRAFEDKHRPAVQAAWKAWKDSVVASPASHLATAAIGAVALKFGPTAFAMVGKLFA